jgi:hypothetical protein
MDRGGFRDEGGEMRMENKQGSELEEIIFQTQVWFSLFQVRGGTLMNFTP